MADQKSKVLIIGGTGYIGKFIVEASVIAGHPTFALVRDTTPSDSAKAALLDKFKNLGVTFLQGDIYKHESLVSAIKQVDVVISTVGSQQLSDQTNIIAAIKEAGNIKRFLPSEFGVDVDHIHAVEPAKSVFGLKSQARRAIEAAGVPYTYVPSGYFGKLIIGYSLPPGDKVTIPGDGNVKGIFNKEEDIATYTIKAIDDPRTLNKTLLIKAPKNIVSYNEIIAIKEKKTGQSLQKIYVPEEKLLKDIEATPMPHNIGLAINHSVFVKGDMTNFELDPAKEVEASELYPDVKYTPVEELI
ncbi:Isoflavone reductase-like protein [Euphorbia peplus]|nr:Isoflavone reductase-like protein [Euphorbia peplus]